MHLQLFNWLEWEQSVSNACWMYLHFFFWFSYQWIPFWVFSHYYLQIHNSTHTYVCNDSCWLTAVREALLPLGFEAALGFLSLMVTISDKRAYSCHSQSVIYSRYCCPSYQCVSRYSSRLWEMQVFYPNSNHKIWQKTKLLTFCQYCYNLRQPCSGVNAWSKHFTVFGSANNPCHVNTH